MKPNHLSQGLYDTLGSTRVIAIASIGNVENAVPLAEALVAGGLRVIEVLLRTQAAYQAIEAIATQVSQAVVGAGTVLTIDQLLNATQVGAKFTVSPGAPNDLMEIALDQTTPWLPGAMSPTEVHSLWLRGFTLQKFFPARAGIEVVREMAGPYPQVQFIPTGTIDWDNAQRWLTLPNVHCIGGVFPCPPHLIANQRWSEIEQLARKAVAEL